MSGGPHAAMRRPAEKPAAFWPSARRLVGYLRGQRLRVGLVLMLSVASVGLSVLGPKLLGDATNVVFDGFLHGSMDTARLGRILLLTLVLYVVAALLSWAAIYLTMLAVQSVSRRLRTEVEDTVHHVPLSWLDHQPRGDVLSRATNDVDNLTTSLQQVLANSLTALLTVVGILAMMLSISPLLTLVAVGTIPVSVLVTWLVGRRSQRLFKEQWTATGDLNARIEEAFTGHELIRAFGRGAEVQRKVEEANDRLYRAAFRAQFVSGIIMPAMFFVSNLGYVLIAVGGGLRVAAGTLSLGAVQAFIQYSRQFNQPVTQLASMANLMQSGVASAERVFALLDAPRMAPDAARGPTQPAGRGRVVFDRISFSYRDDAPLIHDLSLVAEPGQTVAIVGPTGAGKTTLVNLLMRFYELGEGRILLDGQDIADLPRPMLRSRIGMVLQDTWLFRGSIRDNIAYGRVGATEEEVLVAAQAAHVDAFVAHLPDGYDTQLEDDASNLSAGERQLVTIARAFVAQPDLLILDEATSSVDTRTEVLVQRAMARLREGRTAFVIAHRLSTIRDADLILVMEDGAIVERGTHAELLAAQGRYAALHAALESRAVS